MSANGIHHSCSFLSPQFCLFARHDFSVRKQRWYWRHFLYFLLLWLFFCLFFCLSWLIKNGCLFVFPKGLLCAAVRIEQRMVAHSCFAYGAHGSLFQVHGFLLFRFRGFFCSSSFFTGTTAHDQTPMLRPVPAVACNALRAMRKVLLGFFFFSTAEVVCAPSPGSDCDAVIAY